MAGIERELANAGGPTAAATSGNCIISRREILTGEKAPWDIWSACDVTLAGIMAIRSGEEGGAAVRIPDFRRQEERDAYRHDFGRQKHFDPQRLFPAGHDTELTRNFSPLMTFLTGDSGCSILCKAVDGIALYPQLADDTSRLRVIQDVTHCLRALPQIRENLPTAHTLIAAYPDTLPARVLRQMLDVIADDLTDDLDQKLEAWLNQR